MTYEDCYLELEPRGASGNYTYRVFKADGSSVCPRNECNEACAVLLPHVFVGARCNFKVVDGSILFDDSGVNYSESRVEDLTSNADDEHSSTFSSLKQGDSSLELNVTELEKSRGSLDTDVAMDRDFVYRQNLLQAKAAYDAMREETIRENEEALAELSLEELSGVFEHPRYGKVIVTGHGESQDRWGVSSLYDLPVPLPRHIAKYEQEKAIYDAKKAEYDKIKDMRGALEVKRDRLLASKDAEERKAAEAIVLPELPPEPIVPFSPDDMRGLCNSVVILSGSPTETKDVGRFKKVPVYTVSSGTVRVRVASKSLLPDECNAYTKWVAVVKLMEQLDGLAAALLMSDSLRICFTDRPDMTMAVCVDQLWIGLDFFYEQTIQELAFVLMHEARHLLFEHSVRIGFRNEKLWNLATDLIINKQLVDTFPGAGVDDRTGGALILRIEDKMKQGEYIDVLVSDGSPCPRFSYGGAYSPNIDVANDTAEKVYACLELGVDNYADVKSARNKSRGGSGAKIGDIHIGANDVVDAAIGNKKNAPPKDMGNQNGPDESDIDGAETDGTGFNGSGAEMPDLPEGAMDDLLDAAKQQIIENNGADIGSGEGDGLSIGVDVDASANLIFVLRQYIAMLRAGVDCNGNKISLKSAMAAKKIMAKYMGTFGLRF